MSTSVHKSVNTEARGDVGCIPHLVVAVPDPCIQQMLQMALHLHGYHVTCAPIDLRHPLIWIGEAIRAQPEGLIVDVDLFCHRSVQETIRIVQDTWT